MEKTKAAKRSPWLIRRFIDSEAEFLFVPASRIGEAVKDEGAIPFDAPGVELGHHGEKCSFDAIIEHYGPKDLSTPGAVSTWPGRSS